jgi:alkylation response protein AidB-like acyl-CoA dehydrogenase
MLYRLDRDDLRFTLFDFLGASRLCELPRFATQTAADYEAIVEQIASFAERDLAPLNGPGDRMGAVLESGTVRMPEGFRRAYGRLGELGMVSVMSSPEDGGLGLPQLVHSAAGEAIIGACTSFGALYLLAQGVHRMIDAFGTREQREAWLPCLGRGEASGTMCLTEPHAGSAVGDLTTSAALQVDGTYRIRGTKIFISCGDHDVTRDIVHLVLARAEGDAPGTRGLSLFVVPKWKRDGRRNDVRVVSLERKLGLHAAPTCQLAFGDEGDCEGTLLGTRSEGMRCMFRMMNSARLATGQQGAAIGGAVYEHARWYAFERTQGGGTPIVEYPDVRRMLMTMKAYVEGLRCLVLECALLVDLAAHHPDAAVRDDSEAFLGLMTPVCKAFGADMGFRVTELAVQVFGGMGYTTACPVEQYMRDMKAASLYEGTNGIQAMDLVGRKFLKNRGEHFMRYRATFERALDVAAEQGQHDIAPLAARVRGTLNRFAEAAGAFALRSIDDAAGVGLAATPFLRALGDLICAQLLVRRAAVAVRQLSAVPDSGEGTADPARRRFLRTKIEVARFYVNHLLPEAELNAARVASEDRSALADVFQ